MTIFSVSYFTSHYHAPGKSFYPWESIIRFKSLHDRLQDLAGIIGLDKGRGPGSGRIEGECWQTEDMPAKLSNRMIDIFFISYSLFTLGL